MWNKSVGHRRQVLTVNEHLANDGPGDTSLTSDLKYGSNILALCAFHRKCGINEWGAGYRGILLDT